LALVAALKPLLHALALFSFPSAHDIQPHNMIIPAAITLLFAVLVLRWISNNTKRVCSPIAFRETETSLTHFLDPLCQWPPL
jgi:hypothetical protein